MSNLWDVYGWKATGIISTNQVYLLLVECLNNATCGIKSMCFLQHPYWALKVRSNRASMCVMSGVMPKLLGNTEDCWLKIYCFFILKWRFAVFGQIWEWLDGIHVSYLFLSGCGLISPPQWTVTMCWPCSVIRQHTLCGSGNTDIKCTSRAAFFHLCNMAKNRNILFWGELEKVVEAKLS